jgi:hypothetical protein
MQVGNFGGDGSAIANQKFEIIRQRALAAELARQGRSEEARSARARLLQLLFKLDCLELTSYRPV